MLARRGELEQAVLTRVNAISDPQAVADPLYAQGLREAIPAAIDYALEAIQGSERNPPQIPPILLVQARVAASLGVPLDTVLRRYFAGNALLGDLLVEEAKGIGSQEMKRLLRLQALLFDRLLAAIGEEHRRGEQMRPDTGEERRLELVKGLLAGEPLDPSELAYELEATHLAIIGRGPELQEALKELARSLDRRPLILFAEEETLWAWLGGRGRPEAEELERALSSTLPSGSSLALGEPAEGIEGWRRSHRQAQAAWPIAMRRPEPAVRYAEVALLASLRKDELLLSTLREAYLEPLAHERDGGQAAQQTLRAYFACGRNVSSAAIALGLSRQTVTARLLGIEKRLGRGLESCATEIELALRLEEELPL